MMMKIYRITDITYLLEHHHIQAQIQDILRDGEGTSLTLILKTSRFHTDLINIFRTCRQCFHVQVSCFDFRFRKASTAFKFVVAYVEEFTRRKHEGFVSATSVVDALINKGFISDIPISNIIGGRAKKVKE